MVCVIYKSLLSIDGRPVIKIDLISLLSVITEKRSRMDENQIHMVLLFAGGIFFSRFGIAIWIIQWFMLYHNMIKDKAAIQKAKCARFIILLGVAILCVVVLMGWRP